MTNFDDFISKVKKDILAENVLSFIFLFNALIWIMYFNFYIVFKIIAFCHFSFKILKVIYEYYKVNTFYKKMNPREKSIIEEELPRLFFQGVDYALTENYIIDLKRAKLIPFNSIERVEKYSKWNATIQTPLLDKYVKIYVGNSSYKYLSTSKGIGIDFGKGTELYYEGLYSYIKFKNPNL